MSVPDHREHDRRGEQRRALPDPPRDRRVRRFGHDDDQLRAGVRVEGFERRVGGAASDRRRQVAAADAQAVAGSDPGRGQQAHHLLRPGAGRRHQADRPGPHHVGEAVADAVQDDGPAVGPHDQQAASPRLLLEPELLIQRHVVAEDDH
jgi:hypothetical protein